MKHDRRPDVRKARLVTKRLLVQIPEMFEEMCVWRKQINKHSSIPSPEDTA